MSKHAVRGRTKTNPQDAALLRRRAGAPVGRHRARRGGRPRRARLAVTVPMGLLPVHILASRVGRVNALRARRAAQVIREVLCRPRDLVKRSAAGLSRRARELSVQWTVQARTRADAGMSTAEYAVGTIAACGFAALLWKIVTSAEVRAMLAALIQKALKLAG